MPLGTAGFEVLPRPGRVQCCIFRPHPRRGPNPPHHAPVPATTSCWRAPGQGRRWRGRARPFARDDAPPRPKHATTADAHHARPHTAWCVDWATNWCARAGWRAPAAAERTAAAGCLAKPASLLSRLLIAKRHQTSNARSTPTTPQQRRPPKRAPRHLVLRDSGYRMV